MWFMLTVALSSLAMNPPPAPSLVRVAVVDNSSSMQGERIESVREELEKIITQVPPSAELPLVMIVFAGEVESPQTFTDPKTARQAISRLRAQLPGTAIAPALERAHAELTRFKQSSNVMLLFYSDGEDSDRAGIDRAETRLDQLFAGRAQAGLQQSVFVKRWGGVHARFVERLRAGGHVQVFDAGEMAIDMVTVVPQVTIHSARRTAGHESKLVVAFTPQLTIRGTKSTEPVTARFLCRMPNATGDVQAAAISTATGKPAAITIPVSAENDKLGRIDLVWDVQPLPPSTPSARLVLPQLPQSTLTIPVAIPAEPVTNRMRVADTKLLASAWHDPLRGRVRGELEFTLVVEADGLDSTADRSTTFQLLSGADVQILGKTDKWIVPAPGQYRCQVTLDLPTVATQPGKPFETQALALELKPIERPVYLKYEPEQLRIEHAAIAAPSPQLTRIMPEVLGVSQPQWIDAIDALATCSADVRFRIDGPIADQAVLTLVAPGNVRQPALPPNTRLHTGDKVVPLRIVAQLTPGQSEHLEFTIVPPPNSPAIEYQVTGSITIPVTAPAPFQLVHATAAGAQRSVELVLPDNVYQVPLSVTPYLGGGDVAQLLRYPPVTVRGGNAPGAVVPQTGSLGQPVDVNLSLAPVDAQSFFFDSEERYWLVLQPSVTALAIAGSEVEFRIIRSAPFKRWAVYGSMIGSPLLLLVLAIRCWRHLKTGG